MAKKLLVLGFVLAAAGTWAASADAVQGGYDVATSKLELGFKIVSSERIASDNECYPAPDEIARVLRRKTGEDVVVASDLSSVQGSEQVNVISGSTACNRLVLAIRAGLKNRTFVLDSDYGPVYVQGGQGLSGAALAGGLGPLRSLTAATTRFSQHTIDETSRWVVNCPQGRFPLGGGMLNLTPIGPRGQGIYPHSYERLGVQGGFHVTSVLVDPDGPSGGATSPRNGALQILCGAGLVPIASPHATTFVRRHGTGTVTAHCPGGTQLFAGGFQRTNFTTPCLAYKGVKYGGDYITESRAVGTTGWQVSGAAVDSGGGELTAIAYCARDPSLPLTTVSALGTVPQSHSASVTTPRCPNGRALIAGGFSFGGSHQALFADGYFTRGGRWAATGYGWFGPATLTAYGYCARASDTVDRNVFPKPPPPPPPASSGGGGGQAWIFIAIGLIVVVAVAWFGFAIGRR